MYQATVLEKRISAAWARAGEVLGAPLSCWKI